MGRFGGKYGKRVDSNHDAIRKDFRAAGWKWADTHRLGGGFPDGITRNPNGDRVYLIEIKKLVGKKAPKASTSAKGYTKDSQKSFAEDFPVHVICSVEEAAQFRRANSPLLVFDAGRSATEGTEER